jgi:hypothetical protein
MIVNTAFTKAAITRSGDGSILTDGIARGRSGARGVGVVAGVVAI